MATLYNAIFEEIFKNCSSIVLHDFNQVKGITCQSNVSQFSPIVSFCMSTLQKMFDETIKVLKKTKYNGTIILPQNIYIDRQNRINLLDCVKTSHSAEKKYIIINEQNEIMLTYSLLILIPKCKCGPVVAPLVGFPLESKYLFPTTP